MDLSEMLNLLMVILTLLGLIIEVIRLTLEVMNKASRSWIKLHRRKTMTTKKIDRPSLPN